MYLITKPFTTKTTIKAQEQAFEYFAGIPNKIIYDQDSVFISDENLGSYKLTKDFSSYCTSSDFKAVFCRKADPQSKGKIENVVKYIKQNFLRGRDFKDIETLNRQALDWLDRTGNGKKHQTTQLIPSQEFIEEQKHLLPLKKKHSKQNEPYKSYKVRKDNTICYKSNYYSLPLGTYKNQGTSVLIQLKEHQILVFDKGNNQICTHILNNERGKIIRNTDHKREKSKTLEGLVKRVLEYFGNNETTNNYLNLLQKNMSRYYRDNLQYLIKNADYFSDEIKKDTLIFCIENKVYNAKELIEILNKKQLENEPKNIEIKQVESKSKHKYNLDVEKSEMSNYEKIFS